MDSTSTTTGCLLHSGPPRPHPGPTEPSPTNPPIYAALVAEWWTRGRTVPGWHDAQWTALAGADRPG